MYIFHSSAGAIAVNFSLAEYRRRWSTFWRGNIGTTAEKPGAGLSGMSWTFGMYGTFGICAIRHIRKSERFPKCLTKTHGFDIIIVQRETLKIFNSKRWTYGAERRKRAYIYNVYRRGNIGTARTEKEKVKSQYEKIILSEKPFLLYKTA